MRFFNYEGKGSDGTKLENGKVYMARANGAPDEQGNLREEAEHTPRGYRARKNGSLFSMVCHPEGHHYVLPQYMEFMDE